MSNHIVVCDENARRPQDPSVASFLYAPALLGLLNASATMSDPTAAVDVVAGAMVNQPPSLFPSTVTNYRTAVLFSQPTPPGAILLRFVVMPQNGLVQPVHIAHFLVAFYTSLVSTFPDASVSQLRVVRYQQRAIGYIVCTGQYPNLSQVIQSGGLNITNKFARGSWSNVTADNMPIRMSIRDAVHICKHLKDM